MPSQALEHIRSKNWKNQAPIAKNPLRYWLPVISYPWLGEHLRTATVSREKKFYTFVYSASWA